MVEYLKYNFFVRYTQFYSFAHVNQLLEQWLAKTADQRELRQFRQTPATRFEEEKRAPAGVAGNGLRYQLLRHPSRGQGRLYRGAG